MKQFQIIGLALSILVACAGEARSEGKTDANDRLKCESGPLMKTFGGSQWLVYGCADSQSMAVISTPGSPAMPFYFFLFPKGGAYQVRGEGNGNKVATDAAYKELGALSVAEIRALIEQAKIAQTAHVGADAKLTQAAGIR
jgi:hypothetical protein